MIQRLALVLGAAFAVLVPAAAPAATLLSEDDYAKLVSVQSPVLSPDGKTALAIVRRINWNEDRREADLVAIDISSGRKHTLLQNRKGLSDPAFSPDGRRIAFLADDGDKKESHEQIFVVAAGGGKASPLTHIKSDVEQFAWRPDGAAILFGATDPEPERKGAARFRDSFIFTTEPIVSRSEPRPVHLHLLTLKDGTTQQLTFGPQTVATGEAESTLSWSADGKTVAFTLCPNAILNDQSYSHVALLDVATKQIRPLTAHTQFESNALFSPDGRHIAYMYSDGDSQVTQTDVYVTTIDGGAGTAVSSTIDRPVQDFAWGRDSKSLYFTVPDRSFVQLYQHDLDGATQAVDMKQLAIGSSLAGTIAPDGSFVFIGSETKSPPELYVRKSDGTAQQLTDYNAFLKDRTLASAERITFPTSMQIEGDGVLYLPPGFSPGHKYPLSVFIHGGPTSESALTFDFWSQVMAARGWLVLRPNYRGSTDLGLAYMRGVLYDPEDGPGKDIMAAVDSVRARGIVDDARIGVSGWSYGGIMTAWMISKYHIWKAAVSGASVDDWMTDYGVSDDSLADVDLFHGSPFVANNAPEWRDASAISYVGDVTTPVLILSDIGDNRDAFATSSMYWRALRDNHKDATLRTWPVNGHFPSDPVRTVDVYHYWIQYLADHLK